MLCKMHLNTVTMSETIQFPHKLEGTLQVVLWLHLYPEECKDQIEVFLKIGELDYKLVGEATQARSNITRVCLAEHQYGEEGNSLRLGVADEFRLAVRDLFERRVAFQTCAYSMAPYLFTAYAWSLAPIK